MNRIVSHREITPLSGASSDYPHYGYGSSKEEARGTSAGMTPGETAILSYHTLLSLDPEARAMLVSDNTVNARKSVDRYENCQTLLYSDDHRPARRRATFA